MGDGRNRGRSWYANSGQWRGRWSKVLGQGGWGGMGWKAGRSVFVEEAEAAVMIASSRASPRDAVAILEVEEYQLDGGIKIAKGDSVIVDVEELLEA